MKIHFHGAAQTVTGSKHLIEVNGHSLLLDCGLFQGRRRDTYEMNRNLPFDCRAIDAVILSHAHIDHSGNLPYLIKNGYEGPIYATRATAHLTDLMVRDSGHIHESDVKYVNKRRAKKGEEPVEPLYTIADAERVKGHLREVGYEQPFEPVQGVQVRLFEAGHILGSAGVQLDIEEEHGHRTRVWFSGDIGRRDLPLMRDPVLPWDVDCLIMESTYGDRSHADPAAAFAEVQDVVARTVNRGGKVIVPAFAVGRTQELVYCIHRMIDSGDIPRIPVYVDSPLAVNVTDVFRAHPECFDKEAWAFIEDDVHGAALGFDLLTYVRSVEESKALNWRKEPMVIISASGMAETGRILHHLKNNIEDSRNTVLIVSWQAPHTLGRRLVEGEKRVKIFGEVYQRKAEVAVVNGLSAHADQGLLQEYALRVKGRANKVFLVHGEEKPARALQEKLAAAGMGNVYYPEMHAVEQI